MNSSLKVNLGYRNAVAAIRFLVDVLGFEQLVVYTGETEFIIAHAELRWPGGGAVTIYTTEPNHNSVASLSSQLNHRDGYPPFSVHIDTPDPDSVFSRVTKSNARVIREMKETSMGRGFIVSDPEGLYWSVGTPLPTLIRNSQGQWVSQH